MDLALKKFKIFDSLEIRLPAEVIVRVLKSRLLLFYSIIFLWHAVLNYQLFAGAFFLLFNRKDIVNTTCGYGSQYITVWNQVILQHYFNACLLQEILRFTPSVKFAHFKYYLDKIIPYIFTSVVFPLSILVALNFWGIYAFYPRMIDEYNVTEIYFPSWVNHGLHTTILFLICIEGLIVYRSYSTKIWKFSGLAAVIFGYCLTCVILYYIGGVWPYPLVGMLNKTQRIIYILCNILFGFFFIELGDLFNNKIWGQKHNKVAAPTVAKKLT